jgi:hypothetical protein
MDFPAYKAREQMPAEAPLPRFYYLKVVGEDMNKFVRHKVQRVQLPWTKKGRKLKLNTKSMDGFGDNHTRVHDHAEFFCVFV